MRKILALLLSVILSLFGMERWELKPAVRPEPLPPDPPAKTVERADIDYADMEYYHYDPEAFYGEIEALRDDMAAGAAFPVIKGHYEAIYDALLEIANLSTLINLRFDLDVNDEYASEESLYVDSLNTDMFDAACTVLGELARDPKYEKDFAGLVGEEGADAYAEYEPMSDRDKELSDRESELEQQYDKLSSNSNYTETFNGYTYTIDDLADGYYSGRLSYSDYYDLYDRLHKKKADTLGEIFLELVEIRKEQAKSAGYDSYVDYRYAETYCRDYTKEDAQVFETAVKASMSNMIWGELASMNAFYADCEYLSVDRQLELLGTYVAKISPELKESYDYMMKHGLCIVGSEDCMYDGSYTTEFYKYREPVIFSHAGGDSYDLSTIVHEFGHYNDAFRNPWDDFILDSGSYDLFEIHSTGLECLFLPFYDEIFSKKDAKAVEVTVLGNLLYCVVSGCMEDEFQQYVYSADSLTVESISSKYAEIGAKYGMPSYGPDYSWVEIPHTFHSPLYYISYASSAIVSLDIYSQSLKDRDAAVRKYLSVVHQGAYDLSYFEVLDACGLRDFRSDGYVSEIANAAMKQLRAMNREYKG